MYNFKVLPLLLTFLVGISASISQANSSLGKSSVPSPQSYGGIPKPVNNFPNSRSINGNWDLATANAQVINANNVYQNIDEYSAKPAWAQSSYYPESAQYLLPFGSTLFKGHFANTYSDTINNDYKIAPGDRIIIRIWGVKTYDDVLIVDQHGNIFLPEIGPIQVNGISNSQLQSIVKTKVSEVFTDSLKVYVNLQSAQPVGVFVTGFVTNPGHYAGGMLDSLLTYLDRAGGIDYSRGTFRNIVVKRDNNIIAKFDLYDFLLNGQKPLVQLKEGDVILVGQKETEVAVSGLVKQEALFELKSGKAEHKGQKLLEMASPSNKVSHVSVSGVRNNIPIHYYLSLNDFKDFELVNGDSVDFVADVKGQTIIVKISGSITGASRYPIKKTTTLRDLLSYIEVEKELADVNNLYIKRRSVAEQQKITLQTSLRRLEQSALTSTSSSVDEAKIRVDEATLIQDFVKRANSLKPDGIVVVSRGGVIQDIRLEDGDEIIIPQTNDVVMISGEVMMPKAITYEEGLSLDDYLAAAGGVSNRADSELILIAKANGEVGLASDLGISRGDQILVMPRFDSKNMQLAKDIMQIIYQLAVATKVVVDI